MKRTRIAAVLAALMMVSSMTACGGAKDNELTTADHEAEIALENNGDAAGAADDAGEAADAADDAGDADAADVDAGEAADREAADADMAAEPALAAKSPMADVDFAADAEYAVPDAAEYRADAAGEAAFAEFDGISEVAGAAAEERAASPKADAPDDAYDEPEPVPDVDIIEEPAIEEPAAAPGMLTAGEWRDHDNWGFFTNLVNNGVISFPSFGIDPTHRISVQVRDTADAAVVNARAELLDDSGAVLWQSVTGKDGVAYVFESQENEGVQVRVTAADGTQEVVEVAAGRTDGQGGEVTVTGRSADVVIDAQSVLYEDTQVMFIVDTTGSMWDEMLYLQSDFASIAEELDDPRTTYAVTFYKDEGDTYVTRREDGITTDTKDIRRQLNAESADGGGDEPEAVAQALSESFETEDWSDESVKIAFLIYDAPPHTGTEETLQEAIRTASEKGIHLVPVVSSNGSRETELFGRAAAICTNGSYVFLTDDSGIGGSHLEPIIGDYEVEKLHDIIVRIIKEYQQW